MGGVLEDSYQKFAKDVLIIGVTNLLAGLSALVLLPLLTKTLGAHDYGIWAQVDVTIQLAIGFVGLGLPFALSRFLAAKTNKDEMQDEFYSAFALVTLATLAVSILLVALASPIATAFFDGATQIVRITALIILAWSLDVVFLSLLRARRQMGRYAMFMLLTRCGEIVLIACLVLNDYGISSAVYSVLTIRALIFFILFFFTKSQIGIRRPHFSRIKEYLSFGLPTIPGNIAVWVVASSDRYVIGYFLGATSVGIYSAGYNLGSVPFMVAIVLGFVLPPTLSRLYDKGRMNELKTHLSYSLKYSLALAIPFIFGAATLAEPMLRLFSDADIASKGYFIVPLVALGNLFFGVYIVIAQILVMVKKTRIIGTAWIVSALANLLLNILLVPHMGISGAALTTLIAYLLALGIIAFYSFKEFNFSIEWGFILKSLIASAIMSLVIWKIAPEETIPVILTTVVGAVIYGVTLLLLKGFKKEEMDFIRTLLRKD